MADILFFGRGYTIDATTPTSLANCIAAAARDERRRNPNAFVMVLHPSHQAMLAGTTFDVPVTYNKLAAKYYVYTVETGGE